jgi:LysM repeat protein
MSGKSLFYILISFTLVTFSCRVTRTPVPSGSQKVVTNSYIDQYKDLAISEMKRTGIPASITLAQGMIESDYGRSSLAIKANNHFGIKCHTDWNGPRFFKDDDKKNECFRKYNSPAESFRDHSDFLVSGSRYASLFILNPTDYQSWAKGLKKAGYATNPDYPDMLIRKIEEFALYNYDQASSSSNKKLKIVAVQKKDLAANEEVDSVVKQENNNSNVEVGYSRIFVRNRIYYIVVKEGDTFQSLLEEFQLLKFELQKYNELPQDFSIYPGQILYLQPKRNKADVGFDYHTVKDGETMYQVSQLYGIKMKNLLEMNRMTDGDEPITGQKLWLRSTKPPL